MARTHIDSATASKPRIFLGSSAEAETILNDLGSLMAQGDWALLRPWRVIFTFGKSFLQCLLDNKDTVDFAVLLFTPDDSSTIRGDTYMTPRDNILFELGLYMGRLGPNRALVVCPSDVRPKLPSDFTGYGVVDYDPSQGEPSEYLWPAAVQIKSQFQALWKVETEKRTKTLVEIKFEPTPKGPLIAIYRDPKSSLDWVSEFATSVRRALPSLNSTLLYAAPYGAHYWRLMTRTHASYRALRRAFVDCYQRVLGDYNAANLNLIDLGVGDFDKGHLILEYYLNNPTIKSFNYFPLDVSYDMLTLALDTDTDADASLILQAVLEQGRVTGIHATFSQLRLYNHLFLGPSNNIFLLLGNTLGNELDEVATLQDIRDGMNERDILVTEVQLVEPEPASSEEVTTRIQAAKYFYAGPFIALGCKLDHIDLFAERDDEEASARSIDAVTYKIFCRFKEAHEIQNPLFDRDTRLRIRDAKILVYIVRKYRAKTLSTVFERAGFEVLRQLSTSPPGPRDFRFHYLTARKA